MADPRPERRTGPRRQEDRARTAVAEVDELTLQAVLEALLVIRRAVDQFAAQIDRNSASLRRVAATQRHGAWGIVACLVAFGVVVVAAVTLSVRAAADAALLCETGNQRSEVLRSLINGPGVSEEFRAYAEPQLIFVECPRAWP